jgi:GNAT superfamily N-acetyltransferase
VPVRPATPDDLGEICALICELADYEHMTDEAVFDEAEMARYLFGPTPAASVLIAMDSRTAEVAGFALYFPTFSTFLGRPGLWLEDLFVRPHHRNQGHGRALLERVRSLTEGRVEWAVLDWNTPSIEFYKRLGAEPINGWTRYRWSPEHPGDRLG